MFTEKSWKLPAFAENVAKMFKWVICQTSSQSIHCEWKKGYFLDTVNKVIYFNGSEFFFQPLTTTLASNHSNP